MRGKLRNYLKQLNWSNGVTKDDIMGTITERDNDLRTMVDEYIAEGTYPSADEVLFLIPDQAWQSSQGDAWRGPEIQYVENVETGFEQSPVGQDEHTQPSPRQKTTSSSVAQSGASGVRSGSGSQQASATQSGASQGGARAGQGATGGNRPSGGNPGDGAGRTENPGTQHAGVWPASGPLPDDPNARYQGMASFGQGDRGAAGYQDSGHSEIFTMPPEGGSGDGNQPRGQASGSGQKVGAPGSNAGEVDPAVSGSGETTGQPPVNTGGAGFGNASGGGSQGDAADTADNPRQTGKAPSRKSSHR